MRIGIILVIFMLFSCKEDIAPPNVGAITLNGIPDTLHFSLDTTNRILVQSLLEDDKDLNQTRLFSVGSLTASPSDSSLYSPFTFSFFQDLESNPYQISDSLEIPVYTCAGLYQLNIKATDKTGNEGTGTPVILWIHSSEAPVTTINLPDFSAGFPSFNAGDTIFFQGNVADNVAIQKITIEVLNTGSTVSQSFSYSDTVFTNWDYGSNDAKVALPTTAASGNYEIRVRINDNDGNLVLFRDSIAIN